MKVLSVPGMHCEMCVKRIENAMKAINMDCAVSLADKTVTVNGCTNCGSCVDEVIAELEDLGFEATPVD